MAQDAIGIRTTWYEVRHTDAIYCKLRNSVIQNRKYILQVLFGLLALGQASMGLVSKLD